MVCPHCHKIHPDSSTFCPYTGKAIPAASPTCPSCKRAVTAQAEFCPYCGVTLKPRLSESVVPSTAEVLSPYGATSPLAGTEGYPPAAAPAPEKKKRSWLACGLMITAMVILICIGGLVGTATLGNVSLLSDIQHQVAVALTRLTSQEEPTEISGEPSGYPNGPTDTVEPNVTPTPVQTVTFTPIPTILTPSPTITDTIIPSDTPIPTDTSTPSDTLAPTLNSLLAQGRIVFACNDEEGFAQICIMDADGSNQRVLLNYPKASQTYPFLTADGESVIFTSNRSGDHAIYRYYLDSQKTVQLTKPGGDQAFPQLSPDGSSIVFTDDQGNTTNVYIIDSDGSGRTELYKNGSHAVWSKDGSQLALICFDTDKKPQICLMNSNGSNVQKITDMADVNEWVSWSPDGTELTFVVGRKEDKNRRICKINSDGSGFKTLYEENDALYPSYSPDGNWIVFIAYLDKNVSGKGEVFIMRKDGSDFKRLTNDDKSDWLPFWGK
jgi:dipeptidyl aminopeptidase/acylaminoacyl peptidase/RNA polymerase subunit RPABC4/transcription elongation factor Spt4